MDSDNKEGPTETLESLIKEAETLKKRLDDERQKLNDVTRKCLFCSHIGHKIFIF